MIVSRIKEFVYTGGGFIGVGEPTGHQSQGRFIQLANVLGVEKEVQLAVNEFGKGRSVYISGLPFSFENSRLLYRAILWSCHSEKELLKWFSTNENVEVHAYPANSKYCVVNNTYEPQETVVYKGDGESFALKLDANEFIWYEL